ncbi:MAG TPA: ISL3 family transposase [Acetobacteraceae bacterium]
MFAHLEPCLPAGLLVQQVLSSPDHLVIIASTDQASATCPCCAASSTQVHSHYERSLGDLPSQGQAVKLHVTVRRFRCLTPACPRRTFAEPLAGIAQRMARRTCRLGEQQRQIGLALGGSAGAPLAATLAMPASPSTLLRLVRQGGSSAPAFPPPRVLAVDDWAWRRGHRYGTVLVDLERNRVVDLLPDRQADTLAAWLKTNPTIEVIARDRAGAYADGARRGAPEAIQVADRWHVLRNLGDAVHVAVERHHAVVQRVGEAVMADLAGAPPPSATLAMPAQPEEASARCGQASRERRQARFAEATRLHALGLSISEIARQLDVDRKTLGRWLRAGRLPSWRKPRRGSALDAHIGYLEQRWAEGCRNATRLWREVVAQGFPGRPSTVRAWATRRRQSEPARARSPVTAEGQPWQPPSGRHLARLLTAETEAPEPIDRSFAARLLDEVPALAAAVAAAKRLALLLRKRNAEALEAVLTAAEATSLAGFVKELRKDLPAVQAALDLPWTTSPAEGQVNRIKLIKRSMYGRAGFDLLRARVLRAA